ncbi:hypothetical protein GH733_018559 [Mirounga leonina]|nr:hypothetical protein GH733_018559 [Mirounga leonina]
MGHLECGWLEEAGIKAERLHNGPRLGQRQQPVLQRLHLIFHVALPTEAEFQLVRDVVLCSLPNFLLEGVNKLKISPVTLKEAYVQKLVKVCTDTDRWSLISLSNRNGKNVELKFVDSIQRQFEFSADSFQIILDSLLFFYNCSSSPISERVHPMVIGDSVYGDFEEAFDHLQNRLIATKNPKEIRGGGLLKYSNLLMRDSGPQTRKQSKLWSVPGTPGLRKASMRAWSSPGPCGHSHGAFPWLTLCCARPSTRILQCGLDTITPVSKPYMWRGREVCAYLTEEKVLWHSFSWVLFSSGEGLACSSGVGKPVQISDIFEVPCLNSFLLIK